MENISILKFEFDGNQRVKKVKLNKFLEFLTNKFRLMTNVVKQFRLNFSFCPIWRPVWPLLEESTFNFWLSIRICLLFVMCCFYYTVFIGLFRLFYSWFNTHKPFIKLRYIILFFINKQSLSLSLQITPNYPFMLKTLINGSNWIHIFMKIDKLSSWIFGG